MHREGFDETLSSASPQPPSHVNTFHINVRDPEDFGEEQKLGGEFEKAVKALHLRHGIVPLIVRAKEKEAALGTLITQIKQLFQSPTRGESVS